MRSGKWNNFIIFYTMLCSRFNGIQRSYMMSYLKLNAKYMSIPEGLIIYNVTHSTNINNKKLEIWECIQN